MADLPSQIEELWSRVGELSPADTDALGVVTQAIDLLDTGEARVAEIDPGTDDRVVPGASARWGSFLDRGVVMMPSYVNIGARVGADTMVDTWATVGSCAQIGARVHLSGGVGIGGVLEPPQAAPVMIGDDVFVGSRSMVTEGARVGEGAVLGSGTVLNPSIPVIDAETGVEIARGVVPPWSVVVNAS